MVLGESRLTVDPYACDRCGQTWGENYYHVCPEPLDITKNYHKGNPESVAAHASVTPVTRRGQILRVVAFVKSRGTDGATCDQTERALGMSHQTCSARFTDAKRDGLIVRDPAARRRPTRTGRMAAVFVVP